MSIEVKSNPSLLGVAVRYRNAKGQFTKPHLARYVEFTPPGARKKVVYELPKGRKTKAQAQQLAQESVLAAVRTRESKRIKREEETREAKPVTRKSDLQKHLYPKTKLSKTDILTVSRTLNGPVRIVGYNYTFNSKIPFEYENHKDVIEYLRELIKPVATAIFQKNRAWGQSVQVKIYGSGMYYRASRKRNDVIGISITREEVFNKEELHRHVDFTLDAMSIKFNYGKPGGSSVGGYFQRKINRNKFYITGYRVERVIIGS